MADKPGRLPAFPWTSSTAARLRMANRDSTDMSRHEGSSCLRTSSSSDLRWKRDGAANNQACAKMLCRMRGDSFCFQKEEIRIGLKKMACLENRNRPPFVM